MFKKRIVTLAFIVTTTVSTLAYASQADESDKDRSDFSNFSFTQKRKFTDERPFLPNLENIQNILGEITDLSKLGRYSEHLPSCQRANRQVWKLTFPQRTPVMYDEYSLNKEKSDEISMIEAIFESLELKKFTAFTDAQRSLDGKCFILVSRYIDEDDNFVITNEELAKKLKDQLIDFVSKIHDAGFIHLDLAENILVENDRLCIIDFETGHRINSLNPEDEFLKMYDYLDIILFLYSHIARDEKTTLSPSFLDTLKALGQRADELTNLLDEVREDLNHEALKASLRDQFRSLLVDLTAL